MTEQDSTDSRQELAPDDTAELSDDEENDGLNQFGPEPDTKKPVLSLEEAVSRIPEPLRREMKELLRAEFREVRPI